MERLVLGILAVLVAYTALVVSGVSVGIHDLVRSVSEPRATELSGAVLVQQQHDPPVFSKVVNGTTITWTCPPRNPDEDETAYAARCWALWQAFCAGLPE